MERKVGAGSGIGIPLSGVLVWIWNSMMPENQIPGEVSAMFGALMVGVISWLVPNKQVSLPDKKAKG